MKAIRRASNKVAPPLSLGALPVIPEDSPVCSPETRSCASFVLAGDEASELVMEGIAEKAPWAGTEPDTVKYIIKRYRDVLKAVDNNLVFVPPPSSDEILNQNIKKQHTGNNSDHQYNILNTTNPTSFREAARRQQQHLSEFEFEVHPDVLLAGTPYNNNGASRVQPAKSSFA
eukprot:TRINITY_DN6527_c0_g1_i1.p1 TRINITY_DN6527_c0_g1~~TRINITY_DN6527_c0_g1_i1.p1  ORF type:complete len:173 (+),score=38.91 TRINITY_DN6527_c0_g1_i1:268-786(+)